MNIFIEGSPLLKERSGVGQYTKRLTEAMAALAPSNDYTVFGFRFLTKPVPKNVFQQKFGIRYQFVRFLPGRVYNKLFKAGLSLPVDLLFALKKPDIIWFPNFVAWPLANKRVKSIITVYDLSFINYGQYSSPANRRYMLKFVPRSVAKADRVITISKNSRQEIAQAYGVNPAKIDVIYPAVDHREFYPRPASQIKEVARRYNLPKAYILFVGTLEPRKNVAGILDAYSALPASLRQQYGLVLAGGKGWLDEEIEHKITSCQEAGENIQKLGYVPDEDLPALYSGASVFVYPSFYEGFGIPPLEAMACGVPVVTSDNSSLPEVVAKAGRMVRADDIRAIKDAIADLLTDKKAADQLRRLGLERAKKFSWDKSAAEMLRIMEELTSP